MEEQVRELREDVNKLEIKMDKIDDKLTELLQLKHKGAGALWLVSAIAAIAFAELLRVSFSWFIGK